MVSRSVVNFPVLFRPSNCRCILKTTRGNVKRRDQRQLPGWNAATKKPSPPKQKAKLLSAGSVEKPEGTDALSARLKLSRMSQRRVSKVVSLHTGASLKQARKLAKVRLRA